MSVAPQSFMAPQHEVFYFNLLDKAVQILANKLTQILAANKKLLNEASDSDIKFVKHFRKVQKYLQRLDQQKQSNPKFGATLEPFSRFLKENWDQFSDIASNGTSNDSVFKNMKMPNLGGTSKYDGGSKQSLDKINENLSIASESPAKKQ